MKQCALDHNMTKENYLLAINTGDSLGQWSLEL